MGKGEELERFTRNCSQQRREMAVVASPGARSSAWAVKVKSLSLYNVYNVRVVEIGDMMQAINLAESFLETGQLPAETYVVMSKVGEKNVFYAPV